MQAVYKPHQGEQSLWDFPDGLYRREVAAYRLSEALGLGHRAADGAPGGRPVRGGLAPAVRRGRLRAALLHPARGGGPRRTSSRCFCAFDVVANNADRKSGHVLHGADGRLWGIDHGLCFHVQQKLRTVIWDFAGEEVPALAAWTTSSGWWPPGCRDDLGRAAVGCRGRGGPRAGGPTGAAGIFPEPVGDRPPYPWPLV